MNVVKLLNLIVPNKDKSYKAWIEVQNLQKKKKLLHERNTSMISKVYIS